tara:strand:+ start:1710 stop:1895 length:186 start_codon:yes stop_codon:yes gene_type:complete
MVDIAAGLLRSDKSRAEDWIEWNVNEISYDRKDIWPQVLRGLKEGLKQFASIDSESRALMR